MLPYSQANQTTTTNNTAAAAVIPATAADFVHGEQAIGHLVLSDAQGLYISPALWTHGLNGLPGLLQQGDAVSVLHAASLLVFRPLQDFHDPAAIGREHFIVPLLQHISNKFAQIVEMIGQGMLHEEVRSQQPSSSNTLVVVMSQSVAMPTPT